MADDPQASTYASGFVGHSAYETTSNEVQVAGVELPPVAPMLMQSLRAVGYTTAAALADLVDNQFASAAVDHDRHKFNGCGALLSDSNRAMNWLIHLFAFRYANNFG